MKSFGTISASVSIARWLPELTTVASGCAKRYHQRVGLYLATTDMSAFVENIRGSRYAIILYGTDPIGPAFATFREWLSTNCLPPVEATTFVVAELHALNFMQDGECTGMSKDSTFDDCSAFGSITWAAKRLGLSKDKFLRKRVDLESEGFPKRDGLTDYYHKADVDAWIHHRRRIPDALTDEMSDRKPRTEVDLDAI